MGTKITNKQGKSTQIVRTQIEQEVMKGGNK